MNGRVLDFDQASAAFVTFLVQEFGPEKVGAGRILRDVYGRLSYVTRSPRDDRWNTLCGQAVMLLGPYAAPRGEIIVSLDQDPTAFEQLYTEPSAQVPGAVSDKLRMIDRRLAGEDWLMRPVPLAAGPPRLLFYSLKGGVGRSTAIAITAADLAASGHNVLIVDLDLEAPGVGTLLLAADRTPQYGVTDWFAAVAAGAPAEEMIPDMTGASPFTSAGAVVDVVPAVGRERGAYLSKLARAYMPGSAGARYRGFGFTRKATALVTGLLEWRSYDAVLIDARAGLHETSGGLLLGLGAKSLLFGVDSYQTFDDFRLLFRALAQAFDPIQGGADLRDALKMVHAKAPRDEKDRRMFRERSWDIWSESLYDDTNPIDEQTHDAFVFDLGDESAPHYPLEIIGDELYARFDPRTALYPLSAEAYQPVFGNFLTGARVLLGLS